MVAASHKDTAFTFNCSNDLRTLLFICKILDKQVWGCHFSFWVIVITFLNILSFFLYKQNNEIGGVTTVKF